MKFWSYVNGGFRAMQNAWSQTAYQLRNYAYAPANVPQPISRQVGAFEEAGPGDTTGGRTIIVTAPPSLPAGGL